MSINNEYIESDSYIIRYSKYKRDRSVRKKIREDCLESKLFNKDPLAGLMMEIKRKKSSHLKRRRSASKHKRGFMGLLTKVIKANSSYVVGTIR